MACKLESNSVNTIYLIFFGRVRKMRMYFWKVNEMVGFGLCRRMGVIAVILLNNIVGNKISVREHSFQPL